MKNFIPSLIFLSFISCAHQNSQEISKDIKLEVKKYCFTSEGRGQISVNKDRYTFSYESALLPLESRFSINLSFPFQGEEAFVINFLDDQKDQNEKLEYLILSRTKGVNPKVVQEFISLWAEYFRETIKISQGEELKNKIFNFRSEKDKLISSFENKDVIFKGVASRPSQDFFRLMTFSLKLKEKDGSQALNITLSVRECFKSEEKTGQFDTILE